MLFPIAAYGAVLERFHVAGETIVTTGRYRYAAYRVSRQEPS
jgi:hypothetical protein